VCVCVCIKERERDCILDKVEHLSITVCVLARIILKIETKRVQTSVEQKTEFVRITQPRTPVVEKNPGNYRAHVGGIVFEFLTTLRPGLSSSG